MRMWGEVYAASVGALSPEGGADRALAEFDKRFPAPEKPISEAELLHRALTQDAAR